MTLGAEGKAAGRGRFSGEATSIRDAWRFNLAANGDLAAANKRIRNILRKKLVPGNKMSTQDRKDINNLYRPVLSTFQLSLSVFTSSDIAMARQLLARKYKFIKREKKAVMNHLQKIRDDSHYDSQLSAMQLDVLRDLRRINSYQAAVAYPILEEAGQLRSSRLRRSKKSDEVVLPRVKGPMKASISS